MEELRLLIFKIGDARFAADMEQIDEMVDEGVPRSKGWNVVKFHDCVPLRGPEPNYVHPHVALIRDESARHALLIDQPQNIFHVAVSRVRPFPALLEAKKKNAAVWGVVFIEEEIVLLVDLYKLTFAPSDEGDLESAEEINIEG